MWVPMADEGGTKLWLCARGAAPFQLRPGHDVTIGRGQDCDLSLYSSMLSREHACIRWEGGVPVLFDLESLNGTFIGPDRIRRRRLQDGDVIRLGDLRLLYKSGETPPDPPDDSGPLPVGNVRHAPDPEVSTETRPFSRTEVMHQKVFDYDELGWLAQRCEARKELLIEPQLQSDPPAWLARDPALRADLLWRLLEWGVIAPESPDLALRGRADPEVARHVRLTKRGEKLVARLSSQRTVWNEMASLRYQVRQGPIYGPLRLLARAYRPGGGLAEVTPARMADELTNIYAPDLPPATLAREMRRLLVLGLLAPAPGARGEAWYPADWGDGTTVVSARGRNVLEGFRLEDE